MRLYTVKVHYSCSINGLKESYTAVFRVCDLIQKNLRDFRFSGVIWYRIVDQTFFMLKSKDQIDFDLKLKTAKKILLAAGWAKKRKKKILVKVKNPKVLRSKRISRRF